MLYKNTCLAIFLLSAVVDVSYPELLFSLGAVPEDSEQARGNPQACSHHAFQLSALSINLAALLHPSDVGLEQLLSLTEAVLEQVPSGAPGSLVHTEQSCRVWG